VGKWIAVSDNPFIHKKAADELRRQQSLWLIKRFSPAASVLYREQDQIDIRVTGPL